jgi:nicotinamide-nucleotide amidase
MAETRRKTQETAKRIAELATKHGFTVAAAESLTSGAIASALGEAPDLSGWFSGSVVAYRSETKFFVLGVTPGPVITEQCAREMAVGARRVLDAAVAVSVTGVGGPGPEEEQPAGTVFIGIAGGDGVEVVERTFDGDPEKIIEETTLEALSLLEERMQQILT